MINVTQSFLPPIGEYTKYLEKIWDNKYLTNNGPFLIQLESELKKYLNVNNIQCIVNGTVAIDLAIKALDIEDGSEIITTPFSFVATTTSIIWQRCKPVFVDINEDTFCIDANKIVEMITDKTKAILVVHVYGYNCEVEKIKEIANQYNLKVIYDGAHAFGSKYKGKSLLGYGDITTCSFHATKLFHTVEGGCCVVNDNDVNVKLDLLKKFGFEKEDYILPGTNGKVSEFAASMGLCNLKYIEEIISKRKIICETYDSYLNDIVKLPKKDENLEYNYAYYPVVFGSEESLLKVSSELAKEQINTRRYFYPSLNKLEYLETKYDCPISEDISKRVLCLPLYVELDLEVVKHICEVIKNNI